MGEAVASVEAILMAGRRRGQEVLAVTDNMIWRDVAVKGMSDDRGLTACLLVVYIWMVGQLAMAHVPGVDNVVDGPSRGLGNIRLPDVLEMPVHEMGWTKMGAVELCGRTRRAIWEAGRQWVPCTWRRIVETQVVPEMGQCVQGCRHDEVMVEEGKG